MSRIVGRADDMLVIRGVNVYPSQVEHVLLSTPGVSPHFQLVVEREGTLDTLHIRAEAEDETTEADSIAEAVTRHMRDALGLTVSVDVEPHGSVPRSEGGKLSHTVDHRDL